MGMSAISTETLSLGYGDAVIIDELNLTIPKGEITVFIGSNGCGKSTLLRSLARLMKPRGGSVLLEGRAIAKLPTKEVAKELAILPQGPSAPEADGASAGEARKISLPKLAEAVVKKRMRKQLKERLKQQSLRTWLTVPLILCQADSASGLGSR